MPAKLPLLLVLRRVQAAVCMRQLLRQCGAAGCAPYGGLHVHCAASGASFRFTPSVSV